MSVKWEVFGLGMERLVTFWVGMLPLPPSGVAVTVSVLGKGCRQERGLGAVLWPPRAPQQGIMVSHGILAANLNEENNFCITPRQEKLEMEFLRPYLSVEAVQPSQ